MPQIFYSPLERALDSNGDPLPGAKLNFYKAGTSTRKDTYSDEALTTTHANPVVADADGEFSAIYLLGKYKVVLTDSSDVQQWSKDNYEAITGGTDVTVDNIKALVDIDASNLGGGETAFVRAFFSDTDTGGGHFYWDSDKAKSDANGGTIIDPDTVGTLSATALGTFLDQQGSGVGTGCWVRLHDDRVVLTWWGADDTGAVDSADCLREAAGYLSAIGGGELVIPEGTFLLDSGGTVDLADNVTVSGFGRGSFLKRGTNATYQMVFRINGTSHVTVKDTAYDFNNAGGFHRYVGLRGASPNNIRFFRNRVFDSNPDTATSGDKWAFNLSAESGTVENVWIVGNHSSDDMQLTSGGRGMKNIYVLDNVSEGGTAAGIAITQLDDNQTQENIYIERNSVLSYKSIGIVVGPDDNSTARTGTVGRNWHIKNNIVIHNDSATNAFPIIIRPFNSLDRVEVSGNTCVEMGASRNVGTAIRIIREAALAPSVVMESIQVLGNRVENFSNGYEIAFVDDILVQSNIAANCNIGIVSENVNRFGCKDNNVDNCGTGVRLNDNSEDVLIFDNNITNITNDFSACVLVNAATSASVKVCGNHLSKSGTNSVAAYRQQGGGSITSDVYLNDVGGADPLNPITGSIRTRWFNFGDDVDRMRAPAEQASATATWNPGSIADGAVVSTTVSCTPASPGDLVVASHDQLGANDVLLSAHVESSNTVRVVLHNKTGGAFDLASGTLRVMVTSF